MAAKQLMPRVKRPALSLDGRNASFKLYQKHLLFHPVLNAVYPQDYILSLIVIGEIGWCSVRAVILIGLVMERELLQWLPKWL